MHIKNLVPKILHAPLRQIYYSTLAKKYLIFGRPKAYAESFKARNRRLRESFFENYCTGKGLDIGYGGDLIASNAIGWDFEHGDAQLLLGVADNSFDYVYSSHTLEHMIDVRTAITNWWRVVKVGGFLILYVPHRDLYEKKMDLPSHWNLDHKHFFMPRSDGSAATVGILDLIENTIKNHEIIYIKVCDENYKSEGQLVHSQGEYSIEIVLRKI